MYLLVKKTSLIKLCFCLMQSTKPCLHSDSHSPAVLSTVQPWAPSEQELSTELSTAAALRMGPCALCPPQAPPAALHTPCSAPCRQVPETAPKEAEWEKHTAQKPVS